MVTLVTETPASPERLRPLPLRTVSFGSTHPPEPNGDGKPAAFDADLEFDLWHRVRLRMMLLIAALAGTAGSLGVLERLGLFTGFLDESNPYAFH